MHQDDLCTMIAEQYYLPIYRYCYEQLNFDKDAAQDCTQEVFLIMIRKKARLNLSGNMRVWLYKTADHVIRNYRRKEKKYRNQIPLDDIELVDESRLPDFAVESMLACLTEEEYKLLMEYYNAPHGFRKELAEQHGMTLSALYVEIHRIRNKVKMNNQ